MISCKDSQLITPCVSAVAVGNGLTDWRLRSKKKLDVMTLAAAGRSQPPRSQLTNGQIVSRGSVLSSRQSWSSRLQRATRTAGVGCKHARLFTPRVVDQTECGSFVTLAREKQEQLDHSALNRRRPHGIDYECR